MGNRIKKGSKKKKITKKKDDEKSPLEIVKDDTPDTSEPKLPEVRPLSPEKASEFRIAELKTEIIAGERRTQGLEEKLLKRDEMILDLRKQIVKLRGQNLERKE